MCVDGLGYVYVCESYVIIDQCNEPPPCFLMLMLVQLHLIGSQAIKGCPPSTISTIQAVVESWQAGKILHAS